MPDLDGDAPALHRERVWLTRAATSRARQAALDAAAMPDVTSRALMLRAAF